MSRLLIIIGLFLFACSTPAPELQPFERAAGAALASAWNAGGFPEPTQNDCDFARFSVRIDNAKDYAVDCRSTPEASAGCTNFSGNGSWLSSSNYPVVVISPDWKSDPGIIIHELLHARIYCSNSGKPGDPFDANHADQRFWTAAGGDTSAQSRAIAIYKGTP